MRAIITGYLTGIRFIDVKGVRLAQVDLLQAGTDRHASKTISLYLSSKVLAESFLRKLNSGFEPVCHFLCNLVHNNREIEIEVIELLGMVDVGTDE